MKEQKLNHIYCDSSAITHITTACSRETKVHDTDEKVLDCFSKTEDMIFGNERLTYSFTASQQTDITFLNKSLILIPDNNTYNILMCN